MKSIISLLLVLFVLSPIAPAQDSTGAWQWAHFYTGRDDTFVPHNYITYKDFDADGNVYLLGVYGGDATMDSITGETVSLSENAVSENIASTVLLKYDTVGNLLWRKVVKTRGGQSFPGGMLIKDSLLYVMGNYNFIRTYLYLFDTMYSAGVIQQIPEEERVPPLRFNRYSYIATFDLDGNLQSTIFLDYQSRGLNWKNKFHGKLLNVDTEGNIYFITQVNYRGVEGEPSMFYSYINGTTWVDTLYLPGVDVVGDCLDHVNTYIFKYSPDGHLIWCRPLVSHTVGLAPPPSQHHTNFPLWNTDIWGVDADEEGGMYIAGQIVPFRRNDACELHDYPCHLYFDSIHALTFNNIEEAKEGLPFVLKIDTMGTIQWMRQMNAEVIDSGDPGFCVQSMGLDVYQDQVYWLLRTTWQYSTAIVMDDDISWTTTEFGVNDDPWIVLNKETGAYENEGHTHFSGGVYYDMAHFVHENHIFIDGNFRLPSGVSQREIRHFTTDGTFINSIYCFGDFDQPGTCHASVNDRGDVLMTACIKAPPFSLGDVPLKTTASHSNSVFAVYHDDAFRDPHVFDAQSIEWYQNLRFPMSGTPIALTATATSGLPVSYSCSDSTVARISGDTLMLMHAGMATVTAMQEGNGYYTPATPITKTLLVTTSDIEHLDVGRVSIYPNPTSSWITLRLPTSDAPFTVELYDATGKHLETHYTATFSIAHLPQGTYTLKVHLENTTLVGKVVKE